MDEETRTNVPKKHADIKTILMVVGIIVLLIAAGAAGWFLYQQFHKNNKVISSDSIKESIVPVAQLTTYDYDFTQLLYLSDSNEFLGVDIPLTDKTYIATVDGKTTIGLDASQLVAVPRQMETETLPRLLSVCPTPPYKM